MNSASACRTSQAVSIEFSSSEDSSPPRTLPPDATARNVQLSAPTRSSSNSRAVPIRTTPPPSSPTPTAPVISELATIAATRNSDDRPPTCKLRVWPGSAASCSAISALITISSAARPDISNARPSRSGTAPTASTSAGSTPDSQNVASDSRVSRLRTETGASSTPNTPSTRSSSANHADSSSTTSCATWRSDASENAASSDTAML